MGAPSRSTTTATATVSTTRLKREDFQRTKHDSAFSKWQVLIGPWDWANYEAGKEGAERYRVGNLPAVCGPGLYEIGVAVCRTELGRDVGKLDPGRMVVVYLGQADNVRSRLQHYGRSGAHLVRRYCWADAVSSSSLSSSNGGQDHGTGLFKEIFCRGYPIVYRWAPMKSKSDAERMEAKLLERFDYAWNKVGNGSRRPDDVLKKVEKISSSSYNIPKILRMLQALGEQKVGTPVKAARIDDAPNESLNFIGRVLKFGRSQPRLVSANPSIIVKEPNRTYVCGVTLGDGSTCSKPPVKGRKRCAMHKGKKVTKNLINEPNQVFNGTRNAVSEEGSPICGVTKYDGSPCAKPPFPGRKRCAEHKGMRVNQTISKSADSKCVVDVSLSDLGLGAYCGVDLGDGECCRRQPLKGRKRCDEHKGMRVKSHINKLSLRNS